MSSVPAARFGLIDRSILGSICFGESDWPSAAGSLSEGLDELVTIDRLGLPGELRRCLGTTNLIDNGHSVLRDPRNG